MTRRILASLLAVTFLVLVILEVPLGIFYAQREDDRLANGLERDAAVLATLYEEDLEAGTAPSDDQARAYTERTGARVVVTDVDGVAVIDTDGTVPRDFSTRPEVRAALQGRRATGTRASETRGTDLLYVAVPVASGSEVHGVVRLTFDRHEVDDRVRRFWAGLLGIGIAVMAAMAGIGWAIANWITRPLRTLSSTAERFAGGDLRTEPLEPGAPPEVATLGRTMNEMAARLDALVAEQRSFVADASHQLRTPLTALRLRIENLEATDPGDPAVAEEIDAAVAETERLSALVEDLLHLARAERPTAAVPTDLAEVAAQRVDTWRAVAEAAEVGLQIEIDPIGTALVVPGGAEQVLDNLLDNAIRAAPAASAVLVRLRSDADATPGMVVLQVVDHGDGLDDDAKRAATERFWRGVSGPGSGLGLSIVAAVATQSGGGLRLSDTPGGGLTAEVRVPTAD